MIAWSVAESVLMAFVDIIISQSMARCCFQCSNVAVGQGESARSNQRKLWRHAAETRATSVTTLLFSWLLLTLYLRIHWETANRARYSQSCWCALKPQFITIENSKYAMLLTSTYASKFFEFLTNNVTFAFFSVIGINMKWLFLLNKWLNDKKP